MNASSYIPDGSDLEKKIKERATRFHDGKVSAYVRKCIENDISGRFAPSNKSVLVDLAQQFHPTLAFAFENEFGQHDQPIVVMRLLEALLEANRVAGFNPESSFRLFNSTDQLTTYLAKLSLDQKFQLIYDSTTEQQEVAEDKGSYDATKKVVDSLKKKASTSPAPHTPPPTLPKQKPPGRP